MTGYQEAEAVGRGAPRTAGRSDERASPKQNVGK